MLASPYYSRPTTEGLSAHFKAVEYFLWGARSWVAGASNFLPAEHVALYDTCVRRRDLETGMALMRRLLPILMLMEQGGKYIQYCKYGCALAGVQVGDARPPLQPLSEVERRFRSPVERAESCSYPRRHDRAGRSSTSRRRLRPYPSD